jgi:hypothetical protein
VARDPSVAEGDALVLDAAASDRYPSALFLALGYRRERRDGGRVARIRAPE